MAARAGRPTMEREERREERREAKALVLANLRRGQRWPEAAVHAGLWVRERTLFRWAVRARQAGEAAVLADARHGHPSTLRDPVRRWLVDYCRAQPTGTGQAVQAALRERFGLVVSVSQINRARPPGACVGRAGRAASRPVVRAPEPVWPAGAGGLLLLGAAQETGLLPALEAAIPAGAPTGGPAPPRRLAHQTAGSLRMLLTLLFLAAVGLHRPWDLRGYSGDGLALLTGRRRAYGSRHPRASWPRWPPPAGPTR